MVKKDHTLSQLRQRIDFLEKQNEKTKISSYARKDFGLKDAMIQKEKSDLYNRMQNYLAVEGFYVDTH